MSDDYMVHVHVHGPSIADMDRWAGRVVRPGAEATCIGCGERIVLNGATWGLGIKVWPATFESSTGVSFVLPDPDPVIRPWWRHVLARFGVGI